MTVRNLRTAIYFTQRYEKLRPYDVVMKGKSHLKQKILTICLFFLHVIPAFFHPA